MICSEHQLEGLARNGGAGDIIVADDDRAVVVPIGLAEQLAEKASVHAEWEEFSKEKLEQGGDLRRYYPLKDEARPEYDAWRKEHGL